MHALCNKGLMYQDGRKDDDEAERETNKGESDGAWMGKGSVGKMDRLSESRDEVRRMKRDGKETSFHPPLVCPVAAEPEDIDVLMSKCVNTAHAASSGDVLSLISQDVIYATYMHCIAALL